jgi:aminopeptidase N
MEMALTLCRYLKIAYLAGILLFFSNTFYGQSPEYSSALYDIYFYRFNLEVNNLTPSLQGNVEIHARIIEARVDTMVLELSDQVDVDSVFADQDRTEILHSENLLYIPLNDPALSGESVFMNIYYHIIDGDFLYNRGIVTRTDQNGKSVTWTLSEPYFSRNWFPCSQNLTDKIDSAYLIFTAPDSCLVGSNGVLTEITELENGKRSFEWRTSYPMAFYLISYAVGDYMDYSFYVPISHGDSVLVQNYIYNDSSYFLNNKANIDATGQLLQVFSELFGPYPFVDEKYGHCLAPLSGGMENQTMTTLSEFSFDLVSHELAHQWFGDYVTCSDWQNIWINEGFASYAELLAIEQLKTEVERRVWLLDSYSYIITEPDGSTYVPEEELQNYRRIFDKRLTYEKGAFILHMIRHQLGDDALFYQLLRNFLGKYAFSFASAQDFKQLAEDISQKDFDNFFNQWYYGEGYPILDFRWKQDAGYLTIEIDQQTTAAEITPFFDLLIDLKVYYLGGDTLIQIRPGSNTDQVQIGLHERVYKISPDPDKWLLAEIRSVTRVFDTDLAASFAVFPNPTRDEFYIENYKIGLPFEASLYTSEGVYIDKVSGTEAFISFPTGSLATGFYFVVISRDNISKTFKIEKY